MQCRSPGGVDLDLQNSANQLFEDPDRVGADNPSTAARQESQLDSGCAECVDSEWTTGADPEQLGAAYEQSDAAGGGSLPLMFRGRVYRRIPPGPHMTVTSSDGTRVYLKMRTEGGCGRPAQPKVKVVGSLDLEGCCILRMWIVLGLFITPCYCS